MRRTSLLFWFLFGGLISLPLVAQSTSSAPLYAFSHLAGPTGGYGNADGTGPAARFWNPGGLAYDRSGNLYVTDQATSTLRKVTPAGVVTTLLNSNSYQEHGLRQQILNDPDGNGSYGPPLSPAGVAVDSKDNLYIADSANNIVLKLTPKGTLSIFAGRTGLLARLYHYADGPADQAVFDNPLGLKIDSADNLYVVDRDNHIIRKITPSGVVSTVAGMPPEFGHPDGRGANQELSHPGSVDGIGTAAQFRWPSSIAADTGGSLFVTDEWNHTIRKIAIDGTVTTLAGNPGEQGDADGTGSTATFHNPRGITVDSTGNLYVADLGNATIRRISPSGNVTTVAGKTKDYGTTDGLGANARFTGPRSAAVDASGDIFIGDGDRTYVPLPALHAGTIRRLSPNGTVSTYVGQAGAKGSIDGQGEAALFSSPQDVTIDAQGNAYIADRDNHTIRKITPDGTTSTIAGSAGQADWVDSSGAEARFNHPTGITINTDGNLYVADNHNHVIRKVTPDGTVSTLAGLAGSAGSTDATGNKARFHNPLGISADANGNLYVTDGDYFPLSGDPLRSYGTVRLITPDGAVSTLAGNPNVVYDGQQYTTDNTNVLRGGPRLGRPNGVTVDTQGNVFVADSYLDAIFKITADGAISTVNDQQGEAVFLHTPAGLVIDPSGNLLVSCSHDYNAPQTMIKRITPSGVVETIAGSPGVIGSADGMGDTAQFNAVLGLAIDNQGQIYAADSENHAIRLGTLAEEPLITTHPQSKSVSAGANVEFSVTATGNPAPSYQWYFNGESFDGATSSTLSLTNATTTDSGDYSVVITNELGSITSDVAKLTVTAGNTPSAPSGSSSGGGAPSIWFLLTLVGTALAKLYQQRKVQALLNIL